MKYPRIDEDLLIYPTTPEYEEEITEEVIIQDNLNDKRYREQLTKLINSIRVIQNN